jgi:hypothetical protein
VAKVQPVCCRLSTLCSSLAVYLAASLSVSVRSVSGCSLVFLLHWLARGGLELRGESWEHFAGMEVAVSLVLRAAFVLCRVSEKVVLSEEVVSFCFLVSAPRLQLVEEECSAWCAHWVLQC